MDNKKAMYLITLEATYSRDYSYCNDYSYCIEKIETESDLIYRVGLLKVEYFLDISKMLNFTTLEILERLELVLKNHVENIYRNENYIEIYNEAYEGNHELNFMIFSTAADAKIEALKLQKELNNERLNIL